MEKMLCDGEWQTGGKGLHHCRRFLQMTGNRSDIMVTCAQVYFASIEPGLLD